MKTSILIVMLDFLVCSLLMFVIGKGGTQSQFATSTAPVNPAFSAAAMQAQQEEWNRTYEQETLLTQLNSATTENQQLRGRLNEATTTLAEREANLKAVSEEKARVEQAKAQTEEKLTNVASQLTRVNAEREQLQKEGEAAKESLSKLQTEMTGLQTEQARLQEEKGQLAQQALQLGQTVASQQSTISTLSQEVRASQLRMESQLSDVAHGQQEVEALAESVKNLQSGLSAEEKTRLMQAVADVAKGQQDLQSEMDTLIKSGQSNQVGRSLEAIESGQDQLRQQAEKLGEQIESIKARGPGPYKAVKAARLQLQVAIAARDSAESPTSHFKSAAYPPVVSVDGRSFVVANSQTLGFGWWALGGYAEITQLSYQINRLGDPPWSGPASASACAMRADPHVVAMELDRNVPSLISMELAGPDAALQNTDVHKFHVFKSTAAGLSFPVDTAPDLGDPHYLVIQRALRGLAAWFQNPAYRADIGDYIVTDDGKLVGIMVTRERCLILSKDNLTDCAMTIPLNDGPRFQSAIVQYRRMK